MAECPKMSARPEHASFSHASSYELMTRRVHSGLNTVEYFIHDMAGTREA
jgi:hypothetical protein